jgi:hypothetical protein
VLSSPSECVPSPWRVQGNPSDAFIGIVGSSLNELRTTAVPFVALSLLFGPLSLKISLRDYTPRSPLLQVYTPLRPTTLRLFAVLKEEVAAERI